MTTYVSRGSTSLSTLPIVPELHSPHLEVRLGLYVSGNFQPLWYLLAEQLRYAKLAHRNFLLVTQIPRLSSIVRYTYQRYSQTSDVQFLHPSGNSGLVLSFDAWLVCSYFHPFFLFRYLFSIINYTCCPYSSVIK